MDMVCAAFGVLILIFAEDNKMTKLLRGEEGRGEEREMLSHRGDDNSVPRVSRWPSPRMMTAVSKTTGNKIVSLNHHDDICIHNTTYLQSCD